MINYFQYNNLPSKYITNNIKDFLNEDMPGGDITTINTVPKTSIITAKIIAAEDMIFSGKKIVVHVPTKIKCNGFDKEYSLMSSWLH